MKVLLGTAFALCSCSIIAAHEQSVIADQVVSRIPEADESQLWPLSGSWGGFRSSLQDHGIEFDAGYAVEFLSNISGGMRRGAVVAGLLEVGLGVDTEKAGAWRGGHFHISSLYPHGASLTRKYVGDLQTVSNIDAHDSFRLYELYYEHSWLNDKWNFRVGQITADEEFAVNELALNFMNASFGWPSFVSLNTLNGGPAYYVSALGVRMRFELNDRWFIQSGIYDGDTMDSAVSDARVNASGTRFRLSDNQGVFSMNEIGCRVGTSENAQSLPGVYRLGGWFHTADFVDNYFDRHGAAAIVSGAAAKVHNGNFGIYASAEQMIYREQTEDISTEGLTLFVRLGGSPANRSVAEFAGTSGLAYQGIIPGRNSDIAGLGIAYAHLSRSARKSERADRDVNGTFYHAISDHETVLESFYQISIHPHFTIQPDIQWIIHPGGSTAIPDAIIAGVRVTLLF